jgi:methylmalonyl-CoA/ethylmalonyl-CoA epimerase
LRADNKETGPAKVSLHHIGLVVSDITKAERALLALGLSPGNPPEPDPIQRVAASFVDLTGRGEVFLELLEPTAVDSPISGHLAKKGGLHHLCFRVEDIEAAYRGLVEAGYRPISPPQDCAGMDRSFGRKPTRPSRVAFLLAPIQLLIELLEET